MKKIKPYMQKLDDRGKIVGITQSNWSEVNYIESNKSTTRGNHYHKKTIESFYIISGKIKIEIFNIKTKKNQITEVNAGDIFIIQPFELHTFTMIENSSWINMLTVPIKENDMDFYTIK